MSRNVGDITLQLKLDDKKIYRQIDDAGNKASKRATSAFVGIGKAAVAAFSVAAVTKFTKSCLDLGSNMAEVENVVDTVFGNMSSAVDKWASNAITNFGLSETVAKKYLGTFGQMSSAMGITGKAAFDMSKAVTELTGDVASFYNLSTDEAYTKLKSIWTGETESLKDLGVIMTQTNLDQYALNNGFGKTTAKMTEQEKLMLRFQYVTSALSNASGDFIKTQDSWANQTRILSLRFEQFKATLGQGFIALFTPIVKVINQCLAGLQALAEKFTFVVKTITGADMGASGVAAVSTGAVEAAGNITGIGDAAQTASKKIERSLAGFDQITKLSEPTDTQGSSGATNVSMPGSAEVTGGGSAEEVAEWADDITKALEPLRNISFDKLNESFGKLKKSIMPFGDKFKSVLKTFYEDALVPIASWYIEDYLPVWINACATAFDFLNTVLDAVWPILETVWNDFLLPLGKWTGGVIIDVINAIGSVINWLGGIIQKNSKMFDDLANRMSPFYEAVMKFLNEFKALFENIWNTLIVPILPGLEAIITWILGAITSVLGSLYAAFEGIINIFTGILEFINGVFTGDWEKALNGIKDIFVGIVQTIWGVIEGVVNLIVSIIQTAVDVVVGIIKGIISGLVNIFTSFTEWFTGIFVGAYEAVCSQFSLFTKFFTDLFNGIKNILSNIWNGIWGMIKGVINSILGGVEGMANGVIRALNGMINAMNKLSFDIPDWVPGLGGKKFGFNIKNISELRIPKLAQGGYVKANTPQLAMIGDNRHQGEVVAPEDKLRQMALEAAEMSQGSGELMREAVSILKEILAVLKALDLDIQIDGKSLKDYIVNKINEHTKATGVCEIIT